MRLTKRKEKEKEKQEVASPEESTRVIEREINLGLINDKLNYLTAVINEIAKEAEVDLSTLFNQE